jgi:2-amino-4-hydroxy-6-hydroxymethyldihydropteridine diphosphokinase
VASVYISVGSNIERYQHITAALDALDKAFSPLVISTVYSSEAIGFEGNDFLNLVVGFNCEMSVGELSKALRQIEDDNGRLRHGPKFSSRTLDLDILTYDDCVGVYDGVSLPRDEISKNAFVLLPLVDIAADVLHPQLQRSYQTLWQDYDQSSQSLWPVDFEWQGRSISSAG